MIDKKHDSFFDEENNPEDRKSDELMKMLDGYDKPMKNYAKGDKASGKVTRIGSDYIYADIGSKNEALIKASEFLDEDGAVSVNVGDEVSGFIISQSAGETVISKSLGGQSVAIDTLYDALNSKAPVQGKVTGVAKAGLTVKVMGHRAFCPISQIDIKFTVDVNEYLNKTLDFVISRITEGGKNIVLTRIPLFEAGIEEQFKKLEEAVTTHAVMRGKISKIAEFGLFVQTGDIEGLVHISEVSWERAQKLGDSFTVGQDVEFIVLKAERKEPLRNSKISLSIKQMFDDPWTKIQQNFKVGGAVEGKVTRLADFGAFVELIPGAEGLVHISEMSWGKRIHHPSEVVKPGQSVKVTILAIDENKKAVSLTLKDVADDPWNGIGERFAVGSDVAGVVAKKAKFGYFIDLNENITGLLVFANMTADKKDALKPGDNVTVSIESIDTENRRISLSMGVAEVRKDSEDTKQYLKEQKAKAEKKEASSTEFGAALLEALKSKK
ncbi:MAG: S1 RNA-binding domain-containing protein [Chitinispirillia bacterium]|nr:S1 RNA-binding domain-containing protein [Chitinispirillia bacterium]